MADPEAEATGVGAALFLDTLFALGIDDPFALSEEEKANAIEAAVADGRLDTSRVEALRHLGVLRG